MSYQITFNGSASAELASLIQSVERQLNWQGIHADTAVTDSAEARAPASGVCARDPKECPATIIGHPHPSAVVLLLLIGAVIGFFIGFFIGKRSAASASKPGSIQ